jgi:hypothetical protein
MGMVRALLGVVIAAGCGGGRPANRDAPPEPIARVAADAAVADAAVDAVADAPGVLAVLHHAGCDIEIVERIAGDVFTGPPMTNRQPGQKDYSHSVKYLRCTYRVRLAGVQYRLEHESHHGTFTSQQLDPELCATPAHATTVAESLSRSTSWCTRPRPDLLRPWR